MPGRAEGDNVGSRLSVAWKTIGVNPTTPSPGAPPALHRRIPLCTGRFPRDRLWLWQDCRTVSPLGGHWLFVTLQTSEIALSPFVSTGAQSSKSLVRFVPQPNAMRTLPAMPIRFLDCIDVEPVGEDQQPVLRIDTLFAPPRHDALAAFDWRGAVGAEAGPIRNPVRGIAQERRRPEGVRQDDQEIAAIVALPVLQHAIGRRATTPRRFRPVRQIPWAVHARWCRALRDRCPSQAARWRCR